MKNAHIRVQIGPYEAGSMTLASGGANIEIEVEEGDATEIKQVVKSAVDEAMRAKGHSDYHGPG